MVSLKNKLQSTLSRLLAERYQLNVAPESVVVQRTDPAHEGDLTVVLFPFLKHKIGTPESIGQTLGEALLTEAPEFVGYHIVKGFLNLKVSDAFWLAFLPESVKAGAAALAPNVGKGARVMVEFCSPNTNKPLHLGHLRNIFLGDSVSRILKVCGFTVINSCLFNDKGIHICKSMVAFQKAGGDDSPEKSAKKGDHLVGDYYVAFDQLLKQETSRLVAEGVPAETAAKTAPIQQEAQETYRRWEAGEPEVIALWKKMNGWMYEGFNQTFARLGVTFDKSYYESETYLLGKKVVAEGLEKGVFFKKDDGSVWIDLKDVGLDEKVLLRADGTAIYITQDLAVADLKAEEFGLERSLYVIGNEQDYHLKVLFEILKRLGRPYTPGLYHISYGMVDLPTGKMKSREGTVVDADDILDEMYLEAQKATEEHGKIEGLTDEEVETLYKRLSLGALKYFLLKVDAPKRMLFNPEESIDFKGHTGTFIQYVHARAASILRKADAQGLTYQNSSFAPGLPLESLERLLIARLYFASEAILDAVRAYNPAPLTQYAYELARDFNRFYYELPVLLAPDENVLRLRLTLCLQTRETLRFFLDLLGIEAPDRM